MTYKIKCYLLIYIILFNNITVCAYGIVPSDATETKVYESRNNKTPIIEIAEPNDKGVSLNKYEDYNVDQRNLVINNSVSPVISKFAGAIDKNSNFNSGIEAEIIVNEVVSDKITELNGYTEIAGKKAELIIANPNGIITKEAGFINTSRLSLIVGRNTDIDKLEFEIDKKNELIVENDLDLAKVDSVTLIARIVKLRKEITAKSLRVQTGNNKATKLNNGEYDVTSRENISDKPTLSIDVSAFANIQAGKIYIVSTEEGVGVRMDSNLTTNVDDIIFETKGDIEINKDIVSENNVSIKTTKKLNNRGAVIAKNKNIEIEANAAENNNALMYAKSGDISITSKRLDNLQKSDIKTANGNIKLRVDTLNNIGTRNQEIREGEGYSVSRYKNYRMKKEEEARQRYLENRNKNNFQRLWGWGLLFLGNFYSPYSDSNPNAMQDQVLVHLTHSSSNITANGNIEIISNTVTNRDSNITASKDINITADTLNNSRESFVVGGLKKEIEIIEHYWEYPWGWGWCKGFGTKRYRTRHDPVDIPPQTHHSNTPSLIAAGRNIKLNVKKKLGQDDDIKNKTNYSPIETNRPLPDLNNNHFIIKSRDPSYMFEIRPEFLDLSVFEARKDYETEIKLPEDVVFLGDSFVENEYIKDQLELQKETNKTILANQNQLNSRIQELILNGIEYARLHKDQISYQLNEKQIKELEKDMIHYERRIINDIEVLVPRIYYASIDRAFESLIKAENELEINGETEIVNSGNLEGNNISVSTTGNFINKAGTIRSNKNIKIKSKNIVNSSITNRYGNNNNNITEEFVGEGIIQSDNGNITLESDNNIINIGSTIDSKTGELKLIAGDGISITTQQLHNKVDQGEIYKRETLTNISSNVFTKDLVIKSKKDTSIIGSNINVTNNANIESETLTISSAKNLTYGHTKEEEYSFWKGSKTTTTDTTIVTNLKSNLNIGNNLTINTEQDTNIIGSNLNVTNDIDITAIDGDINIINVKDVIDTVTTVEETKGALSCILSGAVAIATKQLTGSYLGSAAAVKILNKITKEPVNLEKAYVNETVVSSNINSNNFNIKSKKDTNIIGSNINVTNNANIEATNLLVSSVENKKYKFSKEITNETKYDKSVSWKSGYNVSKTKITKTTTTDTAIITNTKSNLNIGNNLTINTEQDTSIIGSNINVKKDININTKDGDVNIMGVKDRIDETISVSKEDTSLFMNISWKGIDIGTRTTTENDTTKYHNESIVSSDIVSGGNINILAKNKNISIIGSNIVTTTKGNIELDAMNDINILSIEELNTVDRNIDTTVLTNTLHIGNVFADIADNVASYHDVKDKDIVSGTTIAVNNTLGLLSNLASAPASLNTFGFYASVNSNIDVTSIRQNTKDVINKESNIISNNGNITIKSRNNDITQKGSNIVASNDIEYIANNNINILSSEDIYESDLNIRNNNIGTTVTITSKPSVGINTGFGNNNIKETKIRNNNSNILSNNGNIKLTTNNKDINIISSNIKSKDTIDITSGNNLNVETKLDKEIKKGNGFNTSLTFGDKSLGISLGYSNTDKDISSINKRASIESENNKTNIKVNNEINLTASNVTINNTTKKLTIRDIQINNKDKQFNTSFGISTSAITQKDKTEHPKGTINLSYNYKNEQTDKLITKDKEITQKETKINSKLDGVVVDMRLLTKDGRSSIEDTALNATDTIINTLDYLIPEPKEQKTAAAEAADILLESGMLIPTALLIKKGLNKLREKIQQRREEKERGRGNNSYNNNNKEPDKDPNEDKVKELTEKKLESETKKKIVEQLEDEKTNKRTRDYLEELNRRLDKKEDKVKTKKSDNQINQDILRGNAPKEIDRVDTGYKGKDEPHIHVKDKAGDIIGIKKDGTLKHDGREGTKIEFSKEVWEYLLKNWFD